MHLTESTHCVFLLGAGATTHLGHPLMRQFMDRARRRYFEIESSQRGEKHLETLLSHFRETFSFQAECHGAAVPFERDWENIEELYTQADLLRQVGNNRQASGPAASTCESIAWSIWDVYRPRFHTQLELKPLAQTIFAPSLIGLHPAVITTNYDTTVEQALSPLKAPAPYYPGFQHWTEFGTVPHSVHSEYQSGQSLPLPDVGIPVVKLHGSSNWFRTGRNVLANAAFTSDSAETTQQSRALVASLHFDPVDQTGQVLKKRRDVELGGEVVPLIVPPMLGKSPESSAVRDQWEAAITILGRARQVWVVGYSFPRTDPFMSRLLFQGLKANRDLQFLGIVDLAPTEQWNARLQELFTPSFRQSRTRYLQCSASDFYRRASMWNREGVSELLAFTDPFEFQEQVVRDLGTGHRLGRRT